MDVAQLEILAEEPGAGLPQFNPTNFDNKIICSSDFKNNGVKMFNPNRLTVTRTVAWPPQGVTKRDSPELHHAGAIEPSTLNVELFLDSYDNDRPREEKKSVREVTDRLIKLTHVIDTKHRPPVCRLTWGKMGNMKGFFQGVLENLALQFNLFLENGTPVRATATCTFKAWTPNTQDLKDQNLMSADVAKVWVVKRGQTLASIAMHEYGDPGKWRPIALANGIDNPADLNPGAVLVLPAIRNA
ncbi:MAG: LysM peptidoglycan-binding domain-containing protein [Nitrosospira sp.]|nr:LysM peptidoglycan-binding domain-containing protein [Nitrosospira sp.]